MKKTYRPGALGALMDEYERAADDLVTLLNTLDAVTFTQILDNTTKDPDCRSVQTIMNHVVRATYGYANYIRQEFNETFEPRKTNYNLQTPDDAVNALKQGLLYTEATLINKYKWKLTYKKLNQHIINTSWGQRFDIDQLLEHAIVHILRHRRQIEKLLAAR